MTTDVENLVAALRPFFESSTRTDANGNDANVVDGLFAIAAAIHRVADRVEDANSVARREPHFG